MNEPSQQQLDDGGVLTFVSSNGVDNDHAERHHRSVILFFNNYSMGLMLGFTELLVFPLRPQFLAPVSPLLLSNL
jgi:hypothetical protein